MNSTSLVEWSSAPDHRALAVVLCIRGAWTLCSVVQSTVPASIYKQLKLTQDPSTSSPSSSLIQPQRPPPCPSSPNLSRACSAATALARCLRTSTTTMPTPAPANVHTDTHSSRLKAKSNGRSIRHPPTRRHHHHSPRTRQTKNFPSFQVQRSSTTSQCIAKAPSPPPPALRSNARPTRSSRRGLLARPLLHPTLPTSTSALATHASYVRCSPRQTAARTRCHGCTSRTTSANRYSPRLTAARVQCGR
ncbi:hypothetical protein PENSPDRAFT_514274 [Peniophora sp. CONT]|nr:hypothetical protein PENSPDRAFT_514274 [Peniophora sp. CONT]